MILPLIGAGTLLYFGYRGLKSSGALSGDKILIEPLPRGKSPPKNSSKWPKFPSKAGYEIVFMQYGPEGKGYYYMEIDRA